MTKRETDVKLRAMATRLCLALMRDRMEEMLETATEAKMTPRETLEYFSGKEIDQREASQAWRNGCSLSPSLYIRCIRYDGAAVIRSRNYSRTAKNGMDLECRKCAVYGSARGW